MTAPPFDIVVAPSVSAPGFTLPAGAVDAHSHVFGPFDLFAPSEKSVYALPEATPDVHAAFRKKLGVAFGILTQPAPYGDDASAMLAAIEGAEGALRGVAVASPTIADDTLGKWKEAGIVGLRFVEMRTPNGERYPGSLGFDALELLAPRMREHGLHAQLWASAAQIFEALPRLRVLGLPVVLDHLGAPDLAQGPSNIHFRAIADAAADGWLWIKLTLCRFFAAAPGYRDVRPFHDTLVETAPRQLLWGSDWPYVRLDPAPDAGAMLDLFGAWTQDEALRQMILAGNPARLYALPGLHGER